MTSARILHLQVLVLAGDVVALARLLCAHGERERSEEFARHTKGGGGPIKIESVCADKRSAKTEYFFDDITTERGMLRDMLISRPYHCFNVPLSRRMRKRVE